MNIKFVLILMIFSFCCFSCSKNDDPPNTEDSSLLGVWKLEDFKLGGTNTIELNECQLNETITFNSNGKLIRKNWEGQIPCSYSNFTQNYETTASGFTVSYEGFFNGENFTYIIKQRIVEISATVLKIETTFDNISGDFPPGERNFWEYSKL